MSKSYRYTFHSADGFQTSTDNYDGTEAERYDAAMDDLSRHCAMDDEWVDVACDDMTYWYRTQEVADTDQDGSLADAWVRRI